MTAVRRPARARAVGIALSVLLPGLGQVWLGSWTRGLGVLAAFGSATVTAAWWGDLFWIWAPVALWLWGIWDTARLPRGASVPLAAAVWLILAYGVGYQATEVDPGALFRNAERARSILVGLVHPDFIRPRMETNESWVEIQVPCSPEPPRAERQSGAIRLQVSPDCGGILEGMIVTADGLWPSYPAHVFWTTPIGDVKLLGGTGNEKLILDTDKEGHLTALIRVPETAQSAMPDITLPLLHRIYIRQERPIGGIELSVSGRYVVQGILETLALALLTTTIGALLAIPVSFLAARNLMTGNLLTSAVYVAVRTILNILRSIEALIMAIIFVVIVGLGPFAGMLALTIHTIAALGKLFSEVIEGIDPGPIEAIRATGAAMPQVVAYGVIPQVVPLFTALTVYRWDINVRSSTIIGFVGGGGIGYFLWQWILLGDYRAVSAAFIAIAVVVVSLDFLSANVRQRLA